MAMPKLRNDRPASEADAADHFPPERSFVIQLSAAEHASRPTKGRVEHVLSGRHARFDDLDGLSQFLGEVLAAERRDSNSQGEE
jgi:hypothetical protein